MAEHRRTLWKGKDAEMKKNFAFSLLGIQLRAV
jgi:hypothetical protein